MEEAQECTNARDIPEGQAHSFAAKQLGMVDYYGHVTNIYGSLDMHWQPPQKCGTIMKAFPVERPQALQSQCLRHPGIPCKWQMII